MSLSLFIAMPDSLKSVALDGTAPGGRGLAVEAASRATTSMAVSATNAHCHFPHGICRDGVCMCDGVHEGATCEASTQTLLRWILRAGVPLMCVAAALVGLFLGGVSRWCYSRFQESRKKSRQKSLMFGAGWKDNDRYIGPQHRRVLQKRAERKAKKKKRKKQKQKARGRSAERHERTSSS